MTRKGGMTNILLTERITALGWALWCSGLGLHLGHRQAVPEAQSVLATLLLAQQAAQDGSSA